MAITSAVAFFSCKMRSKNDVPSSAPNNFHVVPLKLLGKHLEFHFPFPYTHIHSQTWKQWDWRWLSLFINKFCILQIRGGNLSTHNHILQYYMNVIQIQRSVWGAYITLPMLILFCVSTILTRAFKMVVYRFSQG